jgi:WD40 repeat protein
MNPRALSPDGSVVALDGWWLCEPGSVPPGVDLRSKVIDVASGDEILDLGDQNIFRAAFNPGGSFQAGRYVALNYNAIDSDGVAVDGVDVFDTLTGELLFSLDISPTMIGFDPTGRYLVSGTYEGRVTVVDVAAVVGGSPLGDAIIMDAQVATGLVSGVALTADGMLATAASESTFLRLWDIHTGTLVMELRTDFDGAAPPRLAFSPDGTYLLYPSANNVLRRFLTNPDSLVALAQSRVTRSLTSDECLRYLDTDRCP